MKIQINNLTKSYGGKQIFRNYSAVLNANGILLIKGASGIGKTTLLRMIAGLEKPDSGEIIKPDCKISFMFQEDRLIPFVSVMKNLTAVTDSETAKKYLKMMELENEDNSSPASLSGGMRRRISLARALCYNSGLVILDEPFKGLDRPLKAKICDIIKAESEHRDFIIVTHDSDDSKLLGGEITELT